MRKLITRWRAARRAHPVEHMLQALIAAGLIYAICGLIIVTWL